MSRNPIADDHEARVRRGRGKTDDLPLFGEPAGETVPDFNGPEYVPARDSSRLHGQMRRIFALMRDGEWRTLARIEESTNDPPASISAQLRHLRNAIDP